MSIIQKQNNNQQDIRNEEEQIFDCHYRSYSTACDLVRYKIQWNGNSGRKSLNCVEQCTDPISTVDPENLTPEKLKEFQKAQGDVTSALGKLIALTENYPDLKANQNFSELQAQLEGTENRITESRRVYNEAVQEYNLTARRFPGNIVASLFGFSAKTKFEASEGSEKAPEVKF